MSNPFVFINDTFLPRHQATLRIDDLAIQRGYGIFDFFRIDDGRPVFLDDHLGRFEHSASRMRLPIAMTRDALKRILAELMQRNNLPSSGIRLTLTGGYATDGYTLASPNLIISQQPLNVYPRLAEAGIRLVSYPHCRQLCDVKTIDYLLAIWLQPFVRDNGGDDVLYHQGGMVSECPRSNFYIVTRDGTLVTPGDGILAGVTRRHVLEVAGGHLTTQQRPVALDEIRDAKESFVTSTTKGIVPVVRVDDHPVGDGRPGDATRWLSAALSERAKASAIELTC